MASPRPILFASWYTGLGGGETDLVTLAGALAAADFALHLLLPGEGRLAAAWRDLGGTVHVLPFRGATTWFIPALWARLPVVGRMARLLQAQRIALVHSDYHTLPLIAPAARRTQVPLVWTVHGWWFRPKPWQRAFFRPLRAVARSRSIRDGFLGQPPFMPPEALPVVYSGVDTARFTPAVDGAPVRAAAGIAPDAPLVALIARFQPVKGHQVFQALAARVAAQMPEARFIVAGENAFGVSADSAYRDTVLAQAAAHPLLRDRLHYLGFRADVERVIAAADVVVCASDFESYGKVNLEAMAGGKPVVSTGRGGPAETVVHGSTGFLAAPGDAAALADYVLTLLHDPALRARMGAAGRDRVLAHFAAPATTAAYTALFQQALAGHAQA
ncbi:MAG: glycosyltransferase family 4 protein [Anaerolineae bacterium]|jgi:glycosyltransferase involved in cell wall biosynthesis|nr:glycosyltransferase family 4 protein [Anaerolineae bacterium]